MSESTQLPSQTDESQMTKVNFRARNISNYEPRFIARNYLEVRAELVDETILNYRT